MLALMVVVAFYALGTGFDFFFRFLYALLLLTGIGFSWAWLNLRGIELSVTRDAHRGRVGGYLVGQVSITNRTMLPKSWLEVVEATGPSASTSGRGLALVREQVRIWRVETYLAKRGVYRSGQVRVVSQDPFGLFRLRREFLEHNFHALPGARDTQCGGAGALGPGNLECSCTGVPITNG